jgi:hypothetical protein
MKVSNEHAYLVRRLAFLLASRKTHFESPVNVAPFQAWQ